MNSQETVVKESKGLINIILKNWDNLEESQKKNLAKIWNVITYKWQLQILLNLPFLIWWLLDKSIKNVHEFDMAILNYLNIPEWLLSLIGFGK
tara:strand:+ start:167 stop:445 length:279 start_codon:yes stop_codon:yes gene_type:complete